MRSLKGKGSKVAEEATNRGVDEAIDVHGIRELAGKESC